MWILYATRIASTLLYNQVTGPTSVFPHCRHHPPRAPRSPFFDAELCVALACGTVSLFACVLSAFAYAVLHLQREDKVTVSRHPLKPLGNLLSAPQCHAIPMGIHDS